jgi:predicted transcriptional regulator
MLMSNMQSDYDAWFVAEVNKGLADLDAGRTREDAQAAADMDEFFAQLAEENRQAA